MNNVSDLENVSEGSLNLSNRFPNILNKAAPERVNIFSNNNKTLESGILDFGRVEQFGRKSSSPKSPRKKKYNISRRSEKNSKSNLSDHTVAKAVI